jgi:hypothetical protein
VTTDKHKKDGKNYYQGISSVKRMNTQRTMVLYFCIMTVLMCCCLGKCLVVPLSQASKYELNSRKYMAKQEKNALLQQRVVS